MIIVRVYIVVYRHTGISLQPYYRHYNNSSPKKIILVLFVTNTKNCHFPFELLYNNFRSFSTKTVFKRIKSLSSALVFLSFPVSTTLLLSKGILAENVT